jgi:hypothetical protein
MSTYAPPVDSLLKLGRPDGGPEDTDYAPHGIGPEHVPELIRLLQDEELAGGDPESPEVYAQVHAWRALGQLRAESAIEPLLELLSQQEDDETWSDWVTEEVPAVLGMIGPVARPAAAARLEQRGELKRVPTYYSQALTEIALRHPEVRQEVIGHLTRALEAAPQNDPSMNGFLLANLMDLEAEEAWPAIEKAFATGSVDTTIAGDAQRVKWELGLGPEPLRKPITWQPPPPQRLSAKERFDARQRQRKLEKKATKQKRKGK